MRFALRVKFVTKSVGNDQLDYFEEAAQHEKKKEELDLKTEVEKAALIKKQKSEEDVEKSENTKQWKREVKDEKLRSMQKLKIESSLYNPDKVQVQQTSNRGTAGR